MCVYDSDPSSSLPSTASRSVKWSKRTLKPMSSTPLRITSWVQPWGLGGRQVHELEEGGAGGEEVGPGGEKRGSAGTAAGGSAGGWAERRPAATLTAAETEGGGGGGSAAILQHQMLLQQGQLLSQQVRVDGWEGFGIKGGLEGKKRV